ncbi:plasmid stabilization system [Candidatus Magnetoovum chiemensis]|nr:plasmid stabilization system [Candidatus Magnetoovum chiemensis]
MACRVEFHPKAVEDFEFLDNAIKKEIAKKIDALSENPMLGKHLGNKSGIDLCGFYKLYALKKKYRIVYRIIGEHIEVVEVVAIGKRDKDEVYKLVSRRIK